MRGPSTTSRARKAHHAQHDAGVPARPSGRSCATGPRCTATARSSPRPPTARALRDVRRARQACGPARQRAPRAGDHRRPAGRHLPVEQRRAPRGLPRRPLDGRGAAHPEHPAVPRAADLHRQPRRGQGRHRRRLAGRPAGQAAADASRPSSTSLVAGPEATAAEPRRAARDRQAGAPVRRAAGRRGRAPSTGPISTSATPRRCATPPARRATRRAWSTATARRTCTRWRSASGIVGGLTWTDRVLPIVPMFHANSWGLAYAAVMTGASLVMPDRWLQAEPLCRFMREARPTVSGAVPTVWNDVLGLPRPARGDRPRPPTCGWCSAAAPRCRCRCRRRSRSGTASTSCRPGG